MSIERRTALGHGGAHDRGAARRPSFAAMLREAAGAQPRASYVATPLLLLAVACGAKAVDLAGSDAITPSSDPTALGDVREQVTQIAVDELRLYWIGSWTPTDGPYATLLRGCDKNACVKSVVTYDALHVAGSAGFAVRGKEIYWLQLREGPNDLEEHVSACPVTGCVGAPRSVTQPESADTLAVFDENWVYLPRLASHDVRRARLTGTDAIPEFVVALSERALALAIGGDYLYWITGSGGEIVLERSPKNGSGTAQVLAKNLRIVEANQSSGARYPQGGLAVDGSYVYWTENVLAGSINRCPLTGCAGTPESVAGPVPTPLGLLIDGPTAYWEYGDATVGYSVAACALSRCTPSPALASGLDAPNALAADAKYLYFATTKPALGAYGIWGNSVATIARLPK